MKKNKIIPIAITMGSESDLPIMQEAAKALDLLAIEYSITVLSAHRTPEEVANFAKSARANNIAVIIAGAGGAAHLPGMIAAYTELPVIGVPIPLAPLNGQDSLLSIVQMPKGVPVATVSIGNAWNAGILAAQILGASQKDGTILQRILEYKKELRRQVVKKSKLK